MKVNFKAKPRVEAIGGVLPLLIIDDFYEDPDSVRERAFSGHFERMEAGYPGRHEPLSIEEDDVLIALTFIREVVQIAANVKFDILEMSTDFSVLTTPSKAIHKNQSHPHTDGVALAGIIYLNPEEMGGTCFYKNKIINSMLLNEQNEKEWNKYLSEEGLQDTPGYVSDSFSVWELVHSTVGKYNQLVMYVGNAFHSVNVIKDPDPSDITKARLTQRIFVNNIKPA